MRAPRLRRFIRVAVITFIVLAWAVFACGVFQAMYVFPRLMAAGNSYASQTLRSVRADPRFERIEMTFGTTGGGTLLIFGELQTEDDLRELKGRLDAAPPPRTYLYGGKIRWSVWVKQSRRRSE